MRETEQNSYRPIYRNILNRLLRKWGGERPKKWDKYHEAMQDVMSSIGKNGDGFSGQAQAAFILAEALITFRMLADGASTAKEAAELWADLECEFQRIKEL